jgi:hypothetical protein
VLTAIELEYRPAAAVLETTRPLLARENAMRLSHIRRTIALAAAVAVTALAALGAAAAHRPASESIAEVDRPAEQYRSRYQLKLGEARSLLAEVPTGARGVDGRSAGPAPS